MKPPIGKPRHYEGDTVEILYPGEEAEPYGFKVVEQNDSRMLLKPTGYHVRPAPGLHALWLRWRFRLGLVAAWILKH